MTRVRAATAVCGTLLMAYAIGGAVTDPDVDLAGVAAFLAASLIAHDAVWMPAVLLAGVVVTRLTPPRHRAAVQAIAIISAVLGVVAFPLLLGVGRAADNPSIQPLHYGRNLALVLVVVSLGVLASTIPLRRKSAEHHEADPTP